MREPEIRILFDTRSQKREDRDLSCYKDSDICKYKIVKDKQGFIKLYEKHQGSGRFYLDGIYFFFGDDKNIDFSVSIHDTEFNKKWFSIWEGFIRDLYNYFSKMTEGHKKQVYKLFKDPYGGVLSLKVIRMVKATGHCMTEDHGKLMERYDGWFYVEFDSTFWDAFDYDYFKKYLERRGIYNAYWQYDDGRMWMFFKKLTGKKLELALLRFNFLMDIQKELNKEISETTKKFFYLNRPWKSIPRPNHVYTRPYIDRNK